MGSKPLGSSAFWGLATILIIGVIAYAFHLNHALLTEVAPASVHTGASVLGPEYLTLEESVKWYFPCNIRMQYGIGDRVALKSMMEVLRQADHCGPSTVLVDGGLNRGQTAELILESCPDTTFHGVEFQKSLYDMVAAKFKEQPNVHIYHQGWGHENSVVHSSGSGETAVLDKNGEGDEVSVTTMLDFYEKTGAKSFDFMLIDTEGMEPMILEGMHLESLTNRQRFPLFQIEMTQAWVRMAEKLKPLRPKTGSEVATMLEEYGYELYLVGRGNPRSEASWWRVPASFFAEGKGAINTDPVCNVHPETTTIPMTMFNNVLCVHPTYANPILRDHVRLNARNQASYVRSALESLK